MYFSKAKNQIDYKQSAFKKLLYTFCLLMSITISAQMPADKLPKNGSVYGKVVDAKTQEPIPYATVVIKDNTGKTLTGGVSDDKGVFNITKIPQGKILVEIQFIGYETVKKDINLIPGNLKQNLGTVKLTESSATLDEVTVVAETSTITQKVDRKVINVGKDLTSAGTTASELLNNVPSVSVDSQSGNISLRGNENVRVLVDGKPTNISASQLLQQIPSTSIKSIELITNPSAKYNPEGMSGIINIVLHKNANQGFNGSVNTGITAGHYVRYNASTNMNYKTGKVNFFGNYGYNGGDNYNYGVIERPTVNKQNLNIINGNQSHLVKAGADIYLNDKNTLSFYTTQNWFGGEGIANTLISSNNVISSDGRFIQNNKTHSSTYNANYKVEFDKKDHNLEFEATYTTSKSPQDSKNEDDLSNISDLNYKVLNYFNDIENDRNNTLINIDYSNPISKNGKLELGVEYRANTTKNNNITDQHRFVYNNLNQIVGTEPRGNSEFQYDRNIYSGYVNYGHKFGKVTMQLGARLEQYEIEGNFKQQGQNDEKVIDKIFSIYPSAFFTYNPSDKNQFQLSYSRRVDRPSIQQVNPIREWSTPVITSIGNPNLVPQFTNSAEVNYTRKIKLGSLTFGTFYRQINDAISRVIYKDPLDPTDKNQILSFANFKNTDAYGVELSANLKLAKWWRANASVDFYSQKQFGVADLNNPNNQIEVQNEVFNARLSNSFTVSKKLRLQLFSMYRGPQEDIQWKIKNMWMVNLGANYRVLKGKGNITLRTNDIFQTMTFGFNSSNPFTQNGRFVGESRSTYLGFNYRFGAGKNKAKRRRNRDNNEKNSNGFI